MTDIGIYDVNYLDLDLYFQSLTFTGKERLTLTFTALAKLFRSLSVLSIIDIDTYGPGRERRALTFTIQSSNVVKKGVFFSF